MNDQTELNQQAASKLSDKAVRVVQSNALTEAAYTLTLNEQRLILLAASKIKKDQIVTGKTPFSITAQEFSAVFGVENAYPEIRAAEQRLYERNVYFYEDGHYGDQTKPYLKTRWVQSVQYIPNEGEVIIFFSEKIIPFLSMLNEGRFTITYMDILSELTSVYSIRLYMMLSQWRTVGSFYISIDDFKKRLDLQAESYEKVFLLKSKVIDVAVNELNAKSNMVISYEFKKKGRARIGITFFFSEKKEKIVKEIKPIDREKKVRLKTADSANEWEKLHDLELQACQKIDSSISRAMVEAMAQAEDINVLTVMQRLKARHR